MLAKKSRQSENQGAGTHRAVPQTTYQSEYNFCSRQRRSIRLQGYDYAQAGAYFITICAHKQACLFGEIENRAVRLNEYGKIVRDEWLRTPKIRREIQLGEFVIMPNHLHGIVFIISSDSTENQFGMHDYDRANVPVGAHGRAPLHRESRSIGSFIAGFESIVTKRINEKRETLRIPVWQRNYYEHIIRNEQSYLEIADYITNNPAQWDLDELYTRGNA